MLNKLKLVNDESTGIADVRAVLSYYRELYRLAGIAWRYLTTVIVGPSFL
jgi:hypothetical protein